MLSRDLMETFSDPLDKYDDSFIDFDLSLGDNRDDPLAINAMFDKLPSVYEYFVSVETHVGEDLESYAEELENVEAEVRELIEGLLILEKNLPPSKIPTGESIKARSRLYFQRFFSKQLDMEEKCIRAYYNTQLVFIEDVSARDALVDNIWDLLVRYKGVYTVHKDLKSKYNIIHGRTNALRMKKDTLIESARLLRDVVSKGLRVFENEGRRTKGNYTDPEKETGLSYNFDPDLDDE